MTIRWEKTKSRTWKGIDDDGNMYSMPGSQETCTVRTPDGYEGFGWTPEEALSNVEKLLDMMPSKNSIDKDWRKTYADRFGTIPENIFYWWELTRKLQATARKNFSDLFIFDCVYYVSEQQITSRGLRSRQDDTEEIPS